MGGREPGGLFRGASRVGGSIALRPISAANERAFVGTSRRVLGFSVPPEPWSVTGTVCLGAIVNHFQMADACEVALRGANLLVDVAPAVVDDLLEGVSRAGLTVWRPKEQPARREWAGLLDALATGATIAQAARGCHMSQRSAYRCLAEARQALGAATTTAAVAVWAAATRNGWDPDPAELGLAAAIEG